MRGLASARMSRLSQEVEEGLTGQECAGRRVEPLGWLVWPGGPPRSEAKKKGTGATSPQVGWVLRCATVGGARLPATGAQNSGLEESTRELVKASRTGKMQRTTEALAKENKIMRAEMSARSRKDKWRSIALCCCVVWVAR